MKVFSSTHRRRLLSLLAGGAFIAAACHDSTAPRLPSAVDLDISVPSATAGLPLTTAPTFIVRDAGGGTLGGVAITVAVTAGGGTLANAPSVTSSNQATSIGTWTLGRVAGLNTVTVTVGNLQPLVISINGVPGPAASVAVVGGNSQSAFAGNVLPSALVAQVRDQFGNGVPGAAVTFTVSNGGGTLSPATGTTDGSGNAGGVSWKLGKTAVPQAALVSSSGFTTTATATIASDYSVDLRFFGPTPAAEAMAAFTDAAARVRAAVTGDVPDVDIPSLTSGGGLNLGQCGVSGIVLNEVVDDLIIFATVTPIDGPGNILASAGPCFVRLASGNSCVPPAPPPATCQGFSLVGVMRFDADDIGNLASTNRLNAIVLHEMLHVVGVGTNWNARALITGRGTANPRFLGVQGIAGCTEAGGVVTCARGIPVENVGGAGSVDSHWRESVFDTELMTSVAEAVGVEMPLSLMTIQSLADEGYQMNPADSDGYTLPSGFNLLGLRANVNVNEEPAFDVVLQPQFGISPGGAIKSLISIQ